MFDYPLAVSATPIRPAAAASREATQVCASEGLFIVLVANERTPQPAVSASDRLKVPRPTPPARSVERN
jgi:hypothetical protein